MEDMKCPGCGSALVIKIMKPEMEMEDMKNMSAAEMRKRLPVKEEDED